MLEIDYLEDQARRNAAFSLDNMDRLTQRAQGMLTLLLGGAGGAGAYALGQIGRPDAVWAVASLGAVSLWWFALAAWVAVRLLVPHHVRPPAADGLSSLNYLRGPLAQWAQKAGKTKDDQLLVMREQELQNLHNTAAEYRGVNGYMARHIRLINCCAAASPLPALLALLVVLRYPPLAG